MSEKDRSHLIENLAGDLKQVTHRVTRNRILSHFYQANTEYGTRLAAAMGVPLAEVQMAAKQ
ncbi:MAG: hypothetical protein H7039_07670 [Bryobacteraceae bacterium]|nr:hypothetical protein [Bryobacteraceae bacterium]